MNSLRVLLLSTLLSLPLLLGSEAQANAGATQTLRVSINKVLAVIIDPKYKDPQTHDEQNKVLRGLVEKILDYDELTRRAAGQHWARLSNEEQKDLSLAFAELLEATYIDAIKSYKNEEILYKPEAADPRGAVEVPTIVLHKGKEIPITYKMINKSNWVVYDIIIEGVSLVRNYRSQFDDLMLKGTAKELSAKLRAKAKEVTSKPDKK